MQQSGGLLLTPVQTLVATIILCKRMQKSPLWSAIKEAVLFLSIDKHYTSCYDVLHEGRYCMDIQLKRGLLDVCVLAAIKDEDSYGYKIIKDMKPYLELSESTLYTILKRLETANMLTVRTVEHGGRLRKYYRITLEGLKRIEEFKADWKEILSIYRFVTKEGDGNG